MTTAILTECTDRTASVTQWRHFQRPRPELAGLDPVELLARTAGLPGVLRYGTAGREVLLVGEVRAAPGADGPALLRSAHARTSP